MPHTLYGTYQGFFGIDLEDHLDNVLTGLTHTNSGVPCSITNESRRALRDAWLIRVQSYLPDGVALHGDEIYGPTDSVGVTTADMTQFVEAVREGIEIWDLVELHAVRILVAFYTGPGVILVDSLPIGEFTGPVEVWPRAVESIIRSSGFAPCPGLDHLAWAEIRSGRYAGDFVTYVVAAR